MVDVVLTVVRTMEENPCLENLIHEHVVIDDMVSVLYGIKYYWSFVVNHK